MSQGCYTPYQHSWFVSCPIKMLVLTTCYMIVVTFKALKSWRLTHHFLSGGRYWWPAGHADLRGVFRLLQDDVSETGPVPAHDGLQRQEGSPDRRRARQLPAQWAEGERRLRSPVRAGEMLQETMLNPTLSFSLPPPFSLTSSSPHLSCLPAKPIYHSWNWFVSWVSFSCPSPRWFVFVFRRSPLSFIHSNGWIFHHAAFTVTPAMLSINNVLRLFGLFVIADRVISGEMWFKTGGNQSAFVQYLFKDWLMTIF